MDKLYKPTAQLKVSITMNCNNDCPICLNKTTRSRNGKENVLTLDKIKDLVDQAASMGMIGTYWTGGEPMMEYKMLIELMKYSVKKKMIPTIVTNGGLIGAHSCYKEKNSDILKKVGLYSLSTDEIIESLVKAGLERVYFSVDSSHTTLKSANTDVYNIVPTDVVARAIRGFINKGYGKKHKLDAIGYQIRVSATSSGVLVNPTREILNDLMNKCNLKLFKELTEKTRLYSNSKGEVFLRYLGVARLGDAKMKNSSILEDKKGKELFEINCSHFVNRSNAYDSGKYHGDIYIDSSGEVYTCGNHAYPIGNIFTEDLQSIVYGVNEPDLNSSYGMNRKVYNTLLRLSKYEGVGKNAIGEAVRLINSQKPELIKQLNTQCGSCCQLGHVKGLQKIFLDAFEKSK